MVAAEREIQGFAFSEAKAHSVQIVSQSEVHQAINIASSQPKTRCSANSAPKKVEGELDWHIVRRALSAVVRRRLSWIWRVALTHLSSHDASEVYHSCTIAEAGGAGALSLWEKERSQECLRY